MNHNFNLLHATNIKQPFIKCQQETRYYSEGKFSDAIFKLTNNKLIFLLSDQQIQFSCNLNFFFLANTHVYFEIEFDPIIDQSNKALTRHGRLQIYAIGL